MKQYLAIALLGLACAATLISIFGDNSYGRFLALGKSLESQKESNRELGEHVATLKARVSGMRTDNRELEKAARNELGLARPSELIFFFEKKEDAKPEPGAAGRRDPGKR